MNGDETESLTSERKVLGGMYEPTCNTGSGRYETRRTNAGIEKSHGGPNILSLLASKRLERAYKRRAKESLTRQDYKLLTSISHVPDEDDDGVGQTAKTSTVNRADNMARLEGTAKGLKDPPKLHIKKEIMISQRFVIIF